MLQPIPTLPIPGKNANPNYILTDGIGGTISVSVDVLPYEEGTSGYVLVNFSNLLGYSSSTTEKQGYTVVTSTSYASSNLTGISSLYTQTDRYGNLIYSYPIMGCYPTADNKNNIVVSMSTSGTYTGTVNALLEINLLTLQYQYPSSFTQEELFEDLKTLPENVIVELKKVNCEKMQGALGLLKSFNESK